MPSFCRLPPHDPYSHSQAYKEELYSKVKRGVRPGGHNGAGPREVEIPRGYRKGMIFILRVHSSRQLRVGCSSSAVSRIVLCRILKFVRLQPLP